MREKGYILSEDILSRHQAGLYTPANEHDACGVGMIVNLHGTKSHDLIDSALKVLENMKHRGAEGADSKTGDGAGIMIQIPHEFILLQGIPVPEKYGKRCPCGMSSEDSAQYPRDIILASRRRPFRPAPASADIFTKVLLINADACRHPVNDYAYPVSM